MIDFDTAQALLAQAAAPLAAEAVAIANAAGRVLAAPLHARTGAPRTDVSTMDGYAVADAAPGATLTLTGQSAAGAPFVGSVGPGQAVRIFTGAVMPDGADRVVIQEAVSRGGENITLNHSAADPPYIRRAHSDFAPGALLLPIGTRLTARALVTAAAADQAEISVTRQPTVAIISTGDELASPGSAHLRDHAVPESVSIGVAAMAEAAGARVVHRVLGGDDLTALERLAAAALEIADLVIVTGGASVGDRDFAKPMFAAHGLDLIFSKVSIKPGKPVWLGRAGRKLVLGLPGNPTSAMVTARLFMVPLVAQLLGQSGPALSWRTLPLAAPLSATGDRETFVRASWGESGLIPLTNQDSGTQAPLLTADWLIRCPAGQGAMGAGAEVAALNF